MSDIAAFIALNRFGLGIGPADLARLSNSPRAWLLRQIDTPQRIPAALASFPGSSRILKEIHEARHAGPEAFRATIRHHYRRSFTAEVVARARHMSQSKQPFAERMVKFWSNHFTVARTKAIVGPAIPAYEREAIRPHVFGRFEDMLSAVVAHPVMLTYLDNNRSVGPNSRAGRRRGRSLNENLAREILELHTLGVNGGYSQGDVTAFASTLTGWTHGGMVGKRSPVPVSGDFVFRPNMHEPGPQSVLGKRYMHKGVEQARAVLSDLCRHPSTARFIATKLVRHFVADDPPEADIARLAAAFTASDGDLAAVSRALVDLESVWAEPLTKLKTPYELVISAFRALDFDQVSVRLLNVPLKTMGQQPFKAPSPQGWPDEASHWLSPQALLRRIEWLRALAARVPARDGPSALLEQVIGPVASNETRRMVELAPSADFGVALILASAEFQRR